jgi:FKBP-type peptidyl-prolyl cis-trans isomerase FkpA
MSVSTAAHSGGRRGGGLKLWLALLATIAVGVALAWYGAGSLRGERSASGVEVRTVEAGQGAFVKPVDGVLIEYEGRLENGTVFDSTTGRGPAPMIAGQSIPGFSEALGKMQKGGRYRIKIPANLAYGASPPPGGPIPPNANLEFDVHVVEIAPNAAAMMGGGGAGQPQSQPQQPQP